MSTNRVDEARRSARVATTFFVAVEGVDRELVSRRGDISATGIYFESDVFVGAVGSVQFLFVASSNRARELRLVAHLVRSVTLEAVASRPTYGLAFEFMPSSVEAASEVEKFVQYVLLVVDDDSVTEPRLSPRLTAMSLAEARAPEQRAMIRQLSVRAMTLEANWSVNEGELVRVEIAAQGMSRRVRLEGSAVRVTPMGRAHDEPPFEIEVEFQSEVERPPRVSSSSMTFAAVRPEAIEARASGARARARERAGAQAETAEPATVSLPRLSDADDDHEVSHVLDDLFSSLIHPPDDARPKREHLSGTLSRIRLPTLFAIFDMERLTGELSLVRPAQRVVIYVQDGRLVDVEPLSDGATPREHIGRLLAWDDATFEFAVLPVERADRVGLGMTALLLDLAREADEGRARDGSPSDT